MAVTLLGTVIADGDAWGQNIHLYERTSDPTSTSVGDWWYRSDTDEFKAVTNSNGTVTIPAIDPANAGGSVSDYLRATTSNGERAVPLTATADAAYPMFQVVTPDGTSLGVHNAATVNVLPSSAIAQYDAQALSGFSDGDRITTLPDEIGTFDASDGAGVDYVVSGINGHASARADGASDNIGRNSWGSDEAQPNTVFIVCQLLSGAGTTQTITDWSTTTPSATHRYEYGSSNTLIFNGSVLEGRAVDTEPVIVATVHDGANSVIRENARETASGDSGARDISGNDPFRLASTHDGSRFANVDIGEVLVCNSRLSSGEIEEQEQRLANKWGITMVQWTTKTSMNNDHSDAMEAVVGDYIYIMGGRQGSDTGTLSNTDVNSRYDISADSWTTMTPVPEAIRGPFGATDGTYIWHMGGVNSSDNTVVANRRYDPSADSWSRNADLPTRLFNAQAVEIDGVIYAVGGTEDPGDPERDIVLAYDISGDSWSTKTSMPTARENPSVGTDGQYLYAAGGNLADNTPLSAMERYDPAADSWTTLTDAPISFYEGGNLAYINGRLWLSNLYDGTQRVASTYAYNISTDTWSQYQDAPAPARNAPSTVAADGKIFSIGGKEATDGNRTRVVKEGTVFPSSP